MKAKYWLIGAMVLVAALAWGGIDPVRPALADEAVTLRVTDFYPESPPHLGKVSVSSSWRPWPKRPAAG